MARDVLGGFVLVLIEDGEDVPEGDPPKGQIGSRGEHA
jgi:hypothetical protein